MPEGGLVSGLDCSSSLGTNPEAGGSIRISGDGCLTPFSPPTLLPPLSPLPFLSTVEAVIFVSKSSRSGGGGGGVSTTLGSLDFSPVAVGSIRLGSVSLVLARFSFSRRLDLSSILGTEVVPEPDMFLESSIFLSSFPPFNTIFFPSSLLSLTLSLGLGLLGQ
uniref:Uncharacterized protein n=1 Tax=Cacopsylla melanoneura TaxID=428564 RepID=A0A8D8TI69_9HEMI